MVGNGHIFCSSVFIGCELLKPNLVYPTVCPALKSTKLKSKQQLSKNPFIPVSQKQPLIISDKDQMRKWSRSMRSQGNLIAFVPTMGYLHEGHLSLIAEAHKHANIVAVSIYVNPGQFSATEDFSTYPCDFQGDIKKLMSVPGGVDVVFNPKNLYDYGDNDNDVVGGGISNGVVSCVERSGSGHENWVRAEKLEKGLCGISKPVFFRGVATVVTKLFNIVEPDFTVFGKKDYQQWRIIERMVIILSSQLLSLLLCSLITVLSMH